MSPLDDELRDLLHSRADGLAASPDPLAGVERRARTMHRRRVAASVAASALAVAAVAVAVPALQGSSGPDRQVPGAASAPPSVPPSPAASPGARPSNAVAWGGPLDPSLDAASMEQWRAVHGLGDADVLGEVLFRGTTNDRVAVHVYQLWERGGDAHAVVAYSSEAGPEIARDTVLRAGTVALDAVVPGTDLPALVVAHEPSLPTVQYAADGRTFTMVEDEDSRGVVTERTGPSGTRSDRVRLLDGSGAVAYEGEVFAGAPSPSAQPAPVLDPEDPWELRGDPSLVTKGQLDALGADWAARHAATGPTTVVPLYVQRYEVDAGVEVVYLVRAGSGPWSWGVSSLGEGGWSWYADSELAPGTKALAAALPGDEGVERLLVVAAPSMGAALYAGDGKDFRPMTDLAAPGVWLGPVEGDQDVDRYEVLDGDGDLDRPVVRAEVPAFQNAG